MFTTFWLEILTSMLHMKHNMNQKVVSILGSNFWIIVMTRLMDGRTTWKHNDFAEVESIIKYASAPWPIKLVALCHNPEVAKIIQKLHIFFSMHYRLCIHVFQFHIIVYLRQKNNVLLCDVLVLAQNRVIVLRSEELHLWSLVCLPPCY